MMFFSKQFIQETFFLHASSNLSFLPFILPPAPEHTPLYPPSTLPPPSRLRNLSSQVHVTWPDLASWCTWAALTMDVASFRCVRKSDASHETQLQSQAPSWDYRHTRSPQVTVISRSFPIIYVKCFDSRKLALPQMKSVKGIFISSLPHNQTNVSSKSCDY